jgi:hypothetical protein
MVEAAGEPVGQPQGVRDPVRTGHLGDHPGGIATFHTGRRHEQRPRRPAAANLRRVHGGSEESLGNTDDRHAELGMHACAEAGLPGRAQVDVSVNHDQRQPGDALQDSSQGWQLTPPELGRLVRRRDGGHRGLRPHNAAEQGVGCGDERGAGAFRTQVMDVHGSEHLSWAGTANLGHIGIVASVSGAGDAAVRLSDLWCHVGLPGYAAIYEPT